MERVCRKCGKYFERAEGEYCAACGGTTMELPEDRKGFRVSFNGWVYFAVNTVLLLFLVLGHMQGMEYLFLIPGLLALWAVLVREKNRICSVSGKLTAVIFIDVLLVFVSFSDVWIAAMTGNVLSNLPYNMGRWIAFVLLGIFFYLISVGKKSIIFQWIAFECFGLVFPFTWGWRLEHWSGYIQLFFLIYTLLNFVWCLAAKTALTADPVKAAAKRWMAFGLFGMAVFFRFFCVGVIETYLVSFPEKLSSFLNGNLGTGKVILVLLILLAAAVLLGAGDRERCGCDALVMSGIACAVILLKASVVCYIPFGFLAFFLYGFIFVNLLKREKSGRQGYGVNRAAILLIITLSMAVSLYLISIGLWMNVLAGLIFAGIIIPKPGAQPKKRLVPLIMVWMIAEALLAVSRLKMHPEAYLAVAVISVSFFLMLRFLTWKHPSVEIGRKGAKGFLCAAFAVLLFLTVFKNGTAIDFAYDPGANQVTVDIEAKGKENTVSSVVYYWTDGGQPLEEAGYGGAQAVLQKVISVNAGTPAGKCLVVRTLDQNGVWTEKKCFVPDYYFTLTGE